MSEPQEEYETDTDAQPTPGPWQIRHGVVFSPEHRPGDINEIATILASSPSQQDEANANAELIAHAGTAAQEAKEMGYDPQKAVEALPKLLYNLGALAEINSRWRNAESDDPEDMPEEDHEAVLTHMEPLLQTVNALASAEGSGDE